MVRYIKMTPLAYSPEFSCDTQNQEGHFSGGRGAAPSGVGSGDGVSLE